MINLNALTDKIVYDAIADAIQKAHRVSIHTKKLLIENKYVKNFCELSANFAVIDLSDGDKLYIRYEINSWYRTDDSSIVSLQSIRVYDDFIEYTVERSRELNGAKIKSMPEQN